MLLAKEWRLNLKTVSEANCSQHWTVIAKRKKLQEQVLRWKWNADAPKIGLPCAVHLIRVSRRKLDVGDNLPMSFKKIRDTLADLIMPGLAPGQADSSPMITWYYDQISGSPQGIIVKFYQGETK